MTHSARSVSRRIASVLALAAALGGCDVEIPENCDIEHPTEVGEGDVFLWIAADYDAALRCSPSNDCAEGDNNYGLDGYNYAANELVDTKASYVHFPMPLLPEGTEIVEAYVEMFHGGNMEDGQPDAQCLPMAAADAPWDYSTITFNNQPNTPFIGDQGPFYLRVRSEAWSRTGDLADHVQGLVDRDAPNYGFAMFPPSAPTPAIDKGFDSNNTYTRDRDDLGLAPRILIRARLPEDAERVVELPPLTEDNDLPFNGETILVGRVASGEAWPEEWDTAIDDPYPDCGY